MTRPMNDALLAVIAIILAVVIFWIIITVLPLIIIAVLAYFIYQYLKEEGRNDK